MIQPTQDKIHLENNDIEQTHSQAPFSGPGPAPVGPPRYPRRREINWRILMWAAMGTVVLVNLVVMGRDLFFASPEQAGLQQPRFVIPLTPTPSATPSATPMDGDGEVIFLEPTATPTPAPGGQVLVLKPAAEDVGWVVSDDSGPNHMGDTFMYAGSWAGQRYHAVMRFDLSQAPRGAKIYEASLRLTGLKSDQLDSQGEGVWRLHLLDPAIDYRWRFHDYTQFRQAASLSQLEPEMNQEQLAIGRANVFQLSPEQVALLERRLLESTDDFGRTISFRIDGPETGNNLFAWDSGHGASTTQAGPELFLSIGPAPAETPPPHYIIITSTPTPADLLAAAATVVQIRAEAQAVGTATPLPPNWVTPVVVTATPTPENRMTAQAMASMATAVALTTGQPANLATATPSATYVIITPTPTPLNVVTAVAEAMRLTAEAAEYGTATPFPANWVTPVVVTVTPTPENAATAAVLEAAWIVTGTPTPVPANMQTATATPPYVIITSTPTAENLMTAVAQSAQLTAEAGQYGTATPFPANWVTPVVVTVSPTPANQATADYLQALAFVTGTPTPTPANLQTATATPIYMVVEAMVSPTPTVTPSATPQAIPAALVGKVIFLSDREGATPEERERAAEQGREPEVTPQPYVYDLVTGELARLTDIWPYQVAAARESWSADEVYETYNKLLLWTNVEDSLGNRTATEVLAIHYYDHFYKVERIVTRMGAGIVYDPAWSPTSNEIAFVATESGNDEIWVINHDGANPRQLTRNSWEWDKHPSWSPDGQQIVFYSNRTGNRQLWIMNKDGSEQQLLMAPNPYNDWDPVWVKTVEPAP